MENQQGSQPGGSLNGSAGAHDAHASKPAVVDDSPATFKHWFAKNAPTLLIVVAAIVAAQVLASPNWYVVAKVVFGLSLVIFLHELGHHLAAKWCDVHVTAFSIGFGPTIPGCWFKWGETVYKLSLFPLGGYVQMVGQIDGDEGSDGSEEDPRSFRNKSVGARMLIISAGVIMNVILAFVCFILVYRIPGKDRIAAVVYATDTGTPAFAEGLRTGATITQIGNKKDPYFENLRTSVASTSKGEQLLIELKRPQDYEVITRNIEPMARGESNPVIGIQPGDRLTLRNPPAFPNTPAAAARPSFKGNDEIIGTTDPADPSKVTELSIDPRDPKKSQRDFYEFQRRMQDLASVPVTIRVKRKDGEADIVVDPAYRSSFGVIMKMGKITAMRKGSEAEKIGVVASEQNGDLIDKVEVRNAKGDKIVFGSKETPLDPEALPTQLKQWAAELKKAGKEKDAEVVLYLDRQREKKGEERAEIKATLPWDYGWTYDIAVAMSEHSPMPIPELGIAYQIKTIVEDVTKEIPDNPLHKGDGILNYRVTIKDDNGKETTTKWLEGDLESAQWSNAFFALRRYMTISKIEFKVNRDQQKVEVTVIPVPDKSMPLVDRGWRFAPDQRVQKAKDSFDALAIGWNDTVQNVKLVFTGLRQLIVGRLPWRKNLGGPIMIFQQAYYTADYGVWEFVFFMGLISINLAVINFLPIPVLDGGHMVFLVYEWLRGRPATEAVRAGATWAGLAMILSLMLFVFYLDIVRLFKGS